MSEKEIYDRLLNKGFDVKTSTILAKNLVCISLELRPMLEQWLTTGDILDFQSNGISIKTIMNRYDMQYQAALLTMDWILQEPETALTALKKGIR